MVYTKKLEHVTNEVIWPKRPLISSTGLISCFENATSMNNASTTRGTQTKKSIRFRCVAFNKTGDTFLAGDAKGRLWVFFVTLNRYSMIRSLGVPVAKIAFSTSRRTEALVSSEDNTVRCMDVKTHAVIATLHGHRHAAMSLAFQRSGQLALTASIDTVILWNTKDWTRFRTLNAGPGVHQAMFACHGNCVAVCFRDDSILMWDLQTLDLKYKISLPAEQEQRLGQGLHCFDVSSDSRIVVSGGLGSQLYVWELESQALVRVIEMPSSISKIVSLSFVAGHNNIVSVLGDDGKLNFINVTAKTSKINLQISGHAKGVTSFNIDSHGKYVASCTSDGCILLHDLDIARGTAFRIHQGKLKAGVYPEEDELFLSTRSAFGRSGKLSTSGFNEVDGSMDGSISVELKSQSPSSSFTSKTGRSSKLITGLFGATNTALGSTASKRKMFKQDEERSETLDEPEREDVMMRAPPTSTKANKSTKLACTKINVGVDKVPSVYALNQLTPQEAQVNTKRLKGLLTSYGEFPAKYRVLIWTFLLRLPENHAAFSLLVQKGIHPNFHALHDQYPIHNQRLFRRLQRCLSVITHWSAVFGELSYLPALVFPFLKVFLRNDILAFEAVISVLLHWGKDWMQTFPHPPLHILTLIEDQLADQDPQLYDHLVKFNVNAQVFAWSLLRTAFTEVFTKDEWLRLWDHLLANSSDANLIYAAVLAYLQYFRISILGATDMRAIEAFFHQQNAIDMKTFIQLMYKIRLSKAFTLPRLSDAVTDGKEDAASSSRYWPLSVEQYPVFHGYPKFVVDYQLQERERIAIEEAELLQKKKLLNDLEEQTLDLSEQHKKWVRQQQAIIKAEEERRSQSIKEEKKRLKELQRIEETMRQRRLIQIARIEQQARETIQHTGDIREAEFKRLQDQLNLQKEREEYELKSRQEEETLLAMEFKATQRIKQIQLERHNEERLRQIREDFLSNAKRKELQNKIRFDQWKQQDEERHLRQTLDAEKATQMEILNQEMALKRKLEEENRKMLLEKEVEFFQLEKERKLRQLTEDETLKMNEYLRVKKLEDEMLYEKEMRANEAEVSKLLQEKELERKQKLLLLEREQRKANLEFEKRKKFLEEHEKIQNEKKTRDDLEEKLKRVGISIEEDKKYKEILLDMEHEKKKRKDLESQFLHPSTLQVKSDDREAHWPLPTADGAQAHHPSNRTKENEIRRHQLDDVREKDDGEKGEEWLKEETKRTDKKHIWGEKDHNDDDDDDDDDCEPGGNKDGHEDEKEKEKEKEMEDEKEDGVEDNKKKAVQKLDAYIAHIKQEGEDVKDGNDENDKDKDKVKIDTDTDEDETALEFSALDLNSSNASSLSSSSSSLSHLENASAVDSSLEQRPLMSDDETMEEQHDLNGNVDDENENENEHLFLSNMDLQKLILSSSRSGSDASAGSSSFASDGSIGRKETREFQLLSSRLSSVESSEEDATLEEAKNIIRRNA